jgi:hypothetical protein
MINYEPGVWQVLAYRGPVGGAHVDRDHPHRGPPRRGTRGQPGTGIGGGPAGHLPEQPMLAGQVDEAGVPPLGGAHPLPGLGVNAVAGPARRVSSIPSSAVTGGSLGSTAAAATVNAAATVGHDRP